MSTGIKRYEVWVADRELPDDMLMVTLREHLASHAFDEAVERAAFEAAMRPDCDLYHLRRCGQTGHYENWVITAKWNGWLACAKSRANRLGGAE